MQARERRPDAVDGSLAAAHSLTSAGSAVASESAAARASVGSPSTANRSGSLTGMLSGLQALRASQAGSALSKATPESSGDPVRALPVPLAMRLLQLQYRRRMPLTRPSPNTLVTRRPCSAHL